MSNTPLALRPACLKTLSAVEASLNVSNQHEFNGVAALKGIFGLNRVTMKAIFSVRGDHISELVNVTWYDARDQHPSRTEYRLYFQGNVVMQRARAGDNILIGFDSNNFLHFVLIRSGTEGYRAGVNSWENIE